MNTEEKKLMGMRIKMSRQEINLSQEGLAEKLNMKRTNVANYEAGRVIPPGNVLIDMANIFGVSTDYILTGEENLESNLDEDIMEIQRAAKKMTDKERQKMLNLIKLSFEDAFDEVDEDDDDI